MADKKPSIAEMRMARAKEFLDLWLQYHDLFNKARSGEDITREDEERFLRIKSELARRHVILMEFLGDDYIAAQPVTELLRSTVNLRTVSQSAREHFVRIETWWHDTFLRLNETMGNLKYQLEGAP